MQGVVVVSNLDIFSAEFIAHYRILELENVKLKRLGLSVDSHGCHCVRGTSGLY